MRASRYGGGKVYCKCMGEHSETGTYGRFKVDMTRLSWAIWGEGRKGCQVQQPRGQSIKGWVKSSPAPRTGEFRGGSRVCKPEGPCNRSGGCWEHLTDLLPYVK